MALPWIGKIVRNQAGWARNVIKMSPECKGMTVHLPDLIFLAGGNAGSVWVQGAVVGQGCRRRS